MTFGTIKYPSDGPAADRIGPQGPYLFAPLMEDLLDRHHPVVGAPMV
jgi:hypothetical protein